MIEPNRHGRQSQQHLQQSIDKTRVPHVGEAADCRDMRKASFSPKVRQGTNGITTRQLPQGNDVQRRRRADCFCQPSTPGRGSLAQPCKAQFRKQRSLSESGAASLLETLTRKFSGSAASRVNFGAFPFGSTTLHKTRIVASNAVCFIVATTFGSKLLVTKAKQGSPTAPLYRHRPVWSCVLRIEIKECQNGEVVRQAKATATSEVLPLTSQASATEDLPPEENPVKTRR